MSKRPAESSSSSSNKRSPVAAEEEGDEETQVQAPCDDEFQEEDAGAGLDYDEEEDTDDEEDDAPEFENADAAQDRRNHAAEAGVIHKIYCENFMNHRKLTVDFCRNINFIHGQNGSGKSAILAALQICLGARASVTHRGDNLGGLVRRNATGGHTATALVRVTLLNGGPDAYKYESYGKRITIERKFDAHGKNGYRILNEQEKMVSNKKKDLEELLDNLNVQVDNPVCIMDQENSKEFIKGNEKEKYKFFAKATDLDRVVHKIQDTKNDLETMVNQCSDAQTRLKSFAQDAEKAEEDLKELQRVLKIDEDVSRMRCFMFWHEAEAKQRALEEGEEKQERALKKEVEREAALAKVTADLESKQTPEEGLAEIERLKGENEEAQNNVDRINRDAAELTKPLKLVEREIGVASRRAKELEQDRKRLTKQISEAHAEASSSGASGEEERRCAAKLEKAKAQAESADAEVREVREKMDPAQQAAAQASSALRQADNASQAQESECRNAQRELQQLRSTQDAPATQFGQKAPQILQMIAKESRFEHKPVGPLGRFVKLRDGVPGGAQKWAKAISVVLPQNLLKTFAVNSMRDMQLLRDILKKCKAEGDHQISVCRFAARYGSGGQPLKGPQGDGFLTVESLLQVDDDLAFNALIESSSMEKAVLFESAEEGENACFSGQRGSLRTLQGVSRILDASGGVTQEKNGNKFYVPGGKSMRGASFGVDVKDQLVQVQAYLADIEKDLHGKRAAQRDAKAIAQEAVREFNGLEKRFHKLNNVERPQLEQAISRLQAELSELQTEEAAVDTSEWEEELGRVKKEAEECEERKADANRNRGEREAEVKAKVQEKHNFEATARQLQKQQEKVEDELASLLREGQARQGAVEKATKKVKEVKDFIAQIKEVCSEALGALEDATEAARKYTAENLGADAPVPMKVPEGKDKDYFKAKIGKLREHKEGLLKKLPKGQRNVDEAMQRALSAKGLYEQKMAGVKLIQKNEALLKSDLSVRLTKWKRFRKSISRITNSKFDETLNQKGQCGAITFDHKAKELHITVQKDNRDSQSQIENVKLLSGGERSYATLSLLVALGECLECPFRVMDEFDVFMDVVSRTVALNQLIEEGRKHKNRQFVFITPQDLSTVTPAPDLKIVKLQNPDRMLEGQATL